MELIYNFKIKNFWAFKHIYIHDLSEKWIIKLKFWQIIEICSNKDRNIKRIRAMKKLRRKGQILERWSRHCIKLFNGGDFTMVLDRRKDWI